jgi:L-Ala-D/L-Glu epimerase
VLRFVVVLTLEPEDGMGKGSFVIEDASVSIIKAPLVTPFRISTGQHDELDNVFIRLKTTEGICGYGEAAVATHITGETVAATLANLQKAASSLKGKEIEAATPSSKAALTSPPRQGKGQGGDGVEQVCRQIAPAFAENHAGLAALEMALLDVTSRVREIPFYQLFQPATSRGQMLTFATDITIVIGSLEEARAAAMQYAKQGFRAFKIKIGKSEELDLSRVLAVREIAPESEIILDANMGFNAGGMLAFLDRLERGGVRPVLLEQPVPKQDWEGLATITEALKGSGTLVCADESVRTLADARRAIDSNAVSAINIKTMKSGFIEGAEIARLAAANGIPLMLGAMMESALSITASAHFAAGLGCFDYIDLDTTFFIKGPLSHSPYIDSTGRFNLTDAAAGIGVTPAFP